MDDLVQINRVLVVRCDRNTSTVPIVTVLRVVVQLYTLLEELRRAERVSAHELGCPFCSFRSLLIPRLKLHFRLAEPALRKQFTAIFVTLWLR